MKNLFAIEKKLEQLIRYSEILGYYHANRNDIEKIINEIYQIKSEIIALIKNKKKEEDIQ